MADSAAGHDEIVERKPKHKGKRDKPKPWDDPSVDHWKIVPFDPANNSGGLLEVSSFSTSTEVNNPYTLPFRFVALRIILIYRFFFFWCLFCVLLVIEIFARSLAVGERCIERSWHCLRAQLGELLAPFSKIFYFAVGKVYFKCFLLFFFGCLINVNLRWFNCFA